MTINSWLPIFIQRIEALNACYPKAQPTMISSDDKYIVLKTVHLTFNFALKTYSVSKLIYATGSFAIPLMRLQDECEK
jgi:hypothetical protein